MNATQIGYVISSDTTEFDLRQTTRSDKPRTTLISHAQKRTLEKTFVLIAVLLRDC